MVMNNAINNPMRNGSASCAKSRSVRLITVSGYLPE
jgi:hypothetical protein